MELRVFSAAEGFTVLFDGDKLLMKTNYFWFGYLSGITVTHTADQWLMVRLTEPVYILDLSLSAQCEGLQPSGGPRGTSV